MNAPRLLCALAGAVMLVAAASAAPQGTDTWARANEEFAAGRFQEALELYQSITRTGETSATLFYNIANTHYRIGQLGEAILNYERALVLEPRHP
jgi:tetratricopeptide (TPR) repeat protein